jgi:DNA-binding response OmpR family regulator
MSEKNKIFVIDDDEDICFLVKNLLEDEFHVDYALNGREGVRSLLGGEYELVLLDIMMPEMSGYEVLDLIKREAPDVKIIFLTAKDSMADMIQGFKKGAARYITKPIDTEELIREIKTTLRNA